MNQFIFSLVQSLLFQCDAEKAHHFTLDLWSRFPLLAEILFETKSKNDLNLRHVIGKGDSQFVLQTPLGLAAGLDKDALCLDFWDRSPFGSIELGTFTPRPQPGNPKPRLFRYPQEKMLLNRMGFNNPGSSLGGQRLKSFRQRNPHSKLILGSNIGKNKDTPLEEAFLDYQKAYLDLAPHSDYVVINVSSPNTPGLRELEGIKNLESIFESLKKVRRQFPRPLFIKLSPDNHLDFYYDIVHVCVKFQLCGIMATNTTLRPDVGVGGVSGKPLFEKAKAIHELLLGEVEKNNLPLEIVAVGGISSISDLIHFYQKGGKWFQIYSSFVFGGPPLVDQLIKELSVHEFSQKTLKNRTSTS